MNEPKKERVPFSISVLETVAKKFDEVAERNCRTRAGHINFLIKREVDHYDMVDSQGEESGEGNE